ncbi:ATP-binding protein [Streptomyces capoamus]|uniref:ATP-binding protein n=1 Tax=Streptomyces capoamus TaxID=68183 RepID=UPI003392306F
MPFSSCCMCIAPLRAVDRLLPQVRHRPIVCTNLVVLQLQNDTCRNDEGTGIVTVKTARQARHGNTGFGGRTMTPRHSIEFQPLSTPDAAGAAEQPLFRGAPPAVTSNLAVRTGLGSTSFAARRIPAATDCCFVARQFTRQTLRHWELSSSVCDDTVQVASELVANAVRHGRSPSMHSCSPHSAVWLALTLRPRTLLCVVRDPGQRRPRLTAPALLEERHRGLPIVDALSTTWGWTDDLKVTGKSVWARLSLPDA